MVFLIMLFCLMGFRRAISSLEPLSVPWVVSSAFLAFLALVLLVRAVVPLVRSVLCICADICTYDFSSSEGSFRTEPFPSEYSSLVQAWAVPGFLQASPPPPFPSIRIDHRVLLPFVLYIVLFRPPDENYQK